MAGDSSKGHRFTVVQRKVTDRAWSNWCACAIRNFRVGILCCFSATAVGRPVSRSSTQRFAPSSMFRWPEVSNLLGMSFPPPYVSSDIQAYINATVVSGVASGGGLSGGCRGAKRVRRVSVTRFRARAVLHGTGVGVPNTVCTINSYKYHHQNITMPKLPKIAS